MTKEMLIISQLVELDRESLRPLRAILTNKGIDEDYAKLNELEERAEELRTQLKNLESAQ